MIMRGFVGTVLGALASGALLSTQAQAAFVAYGSDGSGLNTGQIISEPSGGVTSPGFSGTLFLEVFDSSGGDVFSRTGDAVPTVGTDYTYMFQLVLDADTDGEAAFLSDITLNAFQLGTGDANFSNASTGGGVLGAGMTFGGNSISPKFTFDAGGLAEGNASIAFWFSNPLLDVTAAGTTTFDIGDAMSFGVTTTVASSANATMQVVPVPAAVWLFGSGLLGLTGLARRKRGS